jgi:adenylate kinase
MNLIIFGPQGSGKETQAELICKKLKKSNYIHLSTGEIFREEIKKKTKLGKLASSLINKGNLVPDNITNKIVLNKIKKLNLKKQKVILDGYPRNIDQAKFLLENNISIDYIIVLKLNNKESIKRINSRFYCPKCNANYNTQYKELKPKKKMICDKCGTKLIQREDDSIEFIKKRLKIYSQSTKPIYKLFKEKVIYINGNQNIKDVNKDILNYIKKI